MFIALLMGLTAMVSTYLGGLFALSKSDKLHLILGFSAGAVLGVAFFDLLPEALKLGSGKYSDLGVTSLVAAGFLVFMIVSRVVLLHPHAEDEHCEDSTHKGRLGASSLSIHSFLDGIAMGLAFKVGLSAGILVAVAVLAHDFSDGINTVSVILKSDAEKKAALRWLILDAIAPLLGVISTLFIAVPAALLGLTLAVFCGFFLYIGASDLLPESHHRHPKALTTLLTVAGAATIYVAIRFAGG